MPDFVYITDVHVRSNAPVRRKDPDFLQTIKDKLSEVVNFCNDKNVDALLIGGDLYDSYSPPPSSVLCVVEALRPLKCPAYAILGNHEMLGHQVQSITNRMLGLLHRFENDYPVKLLNHSEDSFSIDINGIKIQAMHYFNGIEEKIKSYSCNKPQPGIFMAHANIVKAPTVFPDHVCYDDCKPPYNVILCSHYHKMQGVLQIGSHMFVSPGALCRGTISIDDLNRTPSFAFISFQPSKISAKIIPLQCAKPSEEVFDVVAVREEREQENRLNDFIEQIKTHGGFNGVESIEQIIMKVENVDERVKNKALEVLRKV